MGALDSTRIPEVIDKYNVYSTSSGLLLGITGEVKLPTFENISTEIDGAAVMGKYKTPILGHFESTQMDLTFRVFDEDVFDLVDPLYPVEITLRGAFQSTIRSTGGFANIPLRIMLRGRCLKFDNGKIKIGEAMGIAISLELFYYAVFMNEKPKLEIDKLNNIYSVNGKDLLEELRKMC